MSLNTPGSNYKDVVMQNAAVATGAGTALECKTVSNGASLAATLQIKGITTATVTFQATIDGTNWVSVLFENLTSGTTGTSATADGLYRATVLGFNQVRANITSNTTGTITITGVATA